MNNGCTHLVYFTDGVVMMSESFVQSRHLTRSDFFPCFGFPDEDNDDGYCCFSCFKNSLKLLSLDWLAIHSRENNAKSLFSYMIFSLSFNRATCFGPLQIKRNQSRNRCTGLSIFLKVFLNNKVLILALSQCGNPFVAVHHSL